MIGISNKILIPKKSQGWLMDDITTSSHTADDVFRDANNNLLYPRGFTFSSDGSKVFIIVSSTASAYLYSLSTPWDITTMSLVGSKNISVGTNWRGLWVNEAGTSLYICTGTSKDVREHVMSTAWDISTLNWDFGSNGTINNKGGYADAIFINTDGVCFVNGNVYSNGYRWRMTKWSYFPPNYYTDTFIEYSAQLKDYEGSIFFKPDGTKLYTIYGSMGNYILQRDLVTPWDISSLPYVSGDFYTPAYCDSYQSGLYFKPDGTKYFTIYGANLIEYSLTA